MLKYQKVCVKKFFFFQEQKYSWSQNNFFFQNFSYSVSRWIIWGWKLRYVRSSLWAQIFVYVAQFKNICNGRWTSCWSSGDNYSGIYIYWMCEWFSSEKEISSNHRTFLKNFRNNVNEKAKNGLQRRKMPWKLQLSKDLKLRAVLIFPVLGNFFKKWFIFWQTDSPQNTITNLKNEEIFRESFVFLMLKFYF